MRFLLSSKTTCVNGIIHLGRIALLALVLLSAETGPGHAGLALCNGIEAPVSVAVGFKGTDDWISEGWWKIEPGECTGVITGDLTNRYVYYLAKIAEEPLAGGEYGFCTDPKAFSIKGISDCQSRGYAEQRFTRIDTGASGANFTYTIGVPAGAAQPLSKRENSNAPPEFSNVVALFNGCSGDRGQRLCVLIAGWDRIEIYETGGTPAALIDQLAALPLNTVVEFDGDEGDQSFRKFGVSYVARLRRISVTPGDSAPGLLTMLQGTWADAARPDNHILINGSELHFFTASKPTGTVLIAITATCSTTGATDGPFLMTHPLSDDDDSNLSCFVIDHVGPDKVEVTDVQTGEKQQFLPAD